jgi:hypothetical protein
MENEEGDKDGNDDNTAVEMQYKKMILRLMGVGGAALLLLLLLTIIATTYGDDDTMAMSVADLRTILYDIDKNEKMPLRKENFERARGDGNFRK